MPFKDVIKFTGLEVSFGLEGSDTDSVMTMFEVSIEPGAKVPVPHYHIDFDEAIWGIEGVVDWTIDGKEVSLGVGDSHFIYRHQVHGFINNTDKLTRFLSVITPGKIGPKYFKELAAILNAPGPHDMEKVKAVMLSFGLVPIGI